MIRGLRKFRVSLKSGSGFLSLLEMVYVRCDVEEAKLTFTSAVLRYLTVPATFVLKI